MPFERTEGRTENNADIRFHDPLNEPCSEMPLSGGVRFKLNVFHSMYQHTPPHTVVATPYSQSACGYMERWSFLQQCPTRAFLLAPAWFAAYRPRLGVVDDLGTLVDDGGAILAVFAPPACMAQLHWRGEQLGVSATIVARLGDSG